MLRSDRRPLFRSRPAIRWLAITATFGSAVAITGVAGVSGAAAALNVAPGALSDKAAAQIAALQSIKTSLTPAQQKLDSHLAVALRRQADKGVAAALPKLSTGVQLTATGRTTVDVSTTGL